MRSEHWNYQAISYFRRQQHLSQQVLADLMGVSRQTVRRWEAGCSRPQDYYQEKLCEILGATARDFGFDSPARPLSTVSRPAFYDPAIPRLPVVPLVGRQKELERLRHLLCEEAHPLIALHGLTGVGKTALVTTLIHDTIIQKHFSDGLLWARLGAKPELDILYRHWGEKLSVASPDALENREAWTTALRSAIGLKRMLIVLDDVWSIEDALSLKIGGPNCAYILTSRSPSIAAMFTVNGYIKVQELSESDGLVLLRTLVSQNNALELDRHQARFLTRAVGALPLALTIMGHYLCIQGISGQARRLQVGIRRLSNPRERLRISKITAPILAHEGPSNSISLSLYSAISASIDFLSESVRAAFYALSVFPPKPASFTEEDAFEQAGCPAEMLDILIDAGLIESCGDGQYMIHQTIADYIRIQNEEVPGTKSA